jgi:hypothetical protein
MDDTRRYPSEQERAVQATILGLILGSVLAMLARRRDLP